MLDVKSLTIFVKVAERRSFQRAARELGITQSGVSNAMRRLEARLGLRLLQRTTRHVALTEDGAAFFERCRRILADLEEAEQVLTQARIKPVGVLRLDLPVAFGRIKVVPLLGQFRARYPELGLEVSLTDRFVDLVDEAIDVAVRVGELRDSSLIARRLTESRQRVVGSPAYLAAMGRPTSLDDLERHRCIPYAVRDTRAVRPWRFQRGGKPVTFMPTDPLSITDGTAMVLAAIQGFGLVQMNDYAIEEGLAAGTLETVLDEFVAVPQTIWLVYPETRHLSPKVRAFVDFMAAAFADERAAAEAPAP